LYLIKRHPIAIETHFEFVFVLTYALPQEILAPLLPPGLTLDCHGDYGFVAAACVQTRNMRAKGGPRFFSEDFFLVGYRIFARYKTSEGRNLRGLYILRSDTDRQILVFGGNIFTHYLYHHARVGIDRTEKDKLVLSIKSDDGIGNVTLKVNLGETTEKTDTPLEKSPKDEREHPEDTDPTGILPPGSIFTSVRDAMKFAGPLPFTFSWERETGSIIRVEGVRQKWRPRAVEAHVQQLSFLQQAPFNQCTPILCSAFYIEDIPYYWKAGICEKVSLTAADTSSATNQERLEH
jgi:uncharacterized protein YqjF (DUF2071 family)